MNQGHMTFLAFAGVLLSRLHQLWAEISQRESQNTTVSVEIGLSESRLLLTCSILPKKKKKKKKFTKLIRKILWGNV